MTWNVLVLGGTTEASALARALARADIPATLSLAGRTVSPAGQPLPLRVGGFGGAAGLARWLLSSRATHLVDATHPFAARISANAVRAAAMTGIPLVALSRPPWQPGTGDRWEAAADMAAAAAALAGPPSRVFLAIGRQELAHFSGLRQHRYLLRLVDAPADPPDLPIAGIEVARGPFDVAGDLDLLQRHAIDCVVAKNSGGDAAAAKLVAARLLGLRVVMVDRPPMPARHEVTSVGAVLHWIASARPPSAERGV